MRQIVAYFNIKHVTGIPHNPTGKAVIERPNRTLKEMLIKQKGRVKTPSDRLNNALLALNSLMLVKKEQEQLRDTGLSGELRTWADQ